MDNLTHVRRSARDRREDERREGSRSVIEHYWPSEQELPNYVKYQIMVALREWARVKTEPMKISDIQKEIWNDPCCQFGANAVQKWVNELIASDRIEKRNVVQNDTTVRGYRATTHNVRSGDRRKEERRKYHD